MLDSLFWAEKKTVGLRFLRPFFVEKTQLFLLKPLTYITTYGNIIIERRKISWEKILSLKKSTSQFQFSSLRFLSSWLINLRKDPRKGATFLHSQLINKIMKFQVKIRKTTRKEKIRDLISYSILGIIIWYFFFKR